MSFFIVYEDVSIFFFAILALEHLILIQYVFILTVNYMINRLDLKKKYIFWLCVQGYLKMQISTH
jgi:hypothetical protein